MLNPEGHYRSQFLDLPQYTINYVFCQMVPNVANHNYELPTYQEWERRLGTMPLVHIPMGCLILFHKT